MSIINPGMNPLSTQFTTNALKVASKSVAQVKVGKELQVKDESKETNDQNDQVTLSDTGKMTAGKQAMLAEQSGATGEATKKKRKEGTKDADALRLFEDGEEALKKGQSRGLNADEVTQELSSVEQTQVDKISNQRPDEIMSREPAVPEQFRVAAEKMVENQMVQGKPTDKLTEIKDVPDPELAMPALKPLENVEIAGIHDTDNRPIPMQMDTSADAGK